MKLDGYGLEAGCFGAEAADLLGGRFGDEVAHEGVLSRQVFGK